jgi:UDP-N-acetylglucosamine 1-carboxyvinyltransferase
VANEHRTTESRKPDYEKADYRKADYRKADHRKADYRNTIGALIRDARRQRGWSQSQLAQTLATSQSAVNRIERGHQNLSLDMIARIAQALDSTLVTLGPGPMHLRVQGGHRLSGSIDVKTSKNAGVALLCASLLTKGRTILRKVARIEEVNRILEVLTSIGVQTRWLDSGNDLEIVPPAELTLDGLDVEAARRTRSMIMLFGPLMHEQPKFRLPYAGGCEIGTRTVEPHMVALRPFGLRVSATGGFYHVKVDGDTAPTKPIVLTERGDTVTENALLAAARRPGITVIRNASPNYMVQDLCFYLGKLGVQIEGIGTTTLTVHGVEHITCDVDYSPSEDPIEAMSMLTAGIVTSSRLTVRRVPIEFLEIELAILSEMGLEYRQSEEYTAANGRTRLVDVTTLPSSLHAPIDKIHPMPFPGLNIDNLPFFAVIAATADGETFVHDWVYENRAIYLTELAKLGADVKLLDPHRLAVHGPTRWRAVELVCPPALRPAVVILLAMLATRGTSVLRNIAVITRGYEDLAERLNSIGARIEAFSDGSGG